MVSAEEQGILVQQMIGDELCSIYQVENDFRWEEDASL